MATPSRSGDDTDEEIDEEFAEDMKALRRACRITGKSLADAGDDSDGGGSEVDDVNLVRDIQRRFMGPLAVIPPEPELAAVGGGDFDGDSDVDDDYETLRAIERRFARYVDARRCSGDLNTSLQLHKSELLSPPISTLEQENSTNGCQNDEIGNIVVDRDIASFDEHCSELRLTHSDNANFIYPSVPFKKSSFPRHGQLFIEAIKKNRSCQKLIRTKLLDLQPKIEENKKLALRIKCIVDFHDSCARRAGRTMCLHRDPRANLISIPKFSKKRKVEDKKGPLFYGPAENFHVQNFRMVLAKHPIALSRPSWSETEGKELVKGVKQQLQEMMLQKSMEPYFESNKSFGKELCQSIGNYEITAEDMHSFTPQVDWDRLASMYSLSRSGAECEARWLNVEDPFINHGAWTSQEDKKLLFIIQERGNIFNWNEIANRLGTNRTPCQCLMRYQRSLNANIIKKEWTEDEDVQLRSIVEVVGEEDWQLVACQMEGRTNRQCSDRWSKILHPSRKRVGRWAVEEDKRLKVAVMLFGPKQWHKIAKFVPGRTQVQCRERWLNVLDPSLNLELWTKEEESKLMDAIAEHGYCWSKIAALIPPRTDNQCRRKWNVLRPYEVHLAREARKIQKAALVCNFADRERERPALVPSDFLMSHDHIVTEIAEEENDEQPKKKRRNLSSENENANSKRAESETDKENQNVDSIEDSTVLSQFILKKKAMRKRKATELRLQDESFSSFENPQPAQLFEHSDHMGTWVDVPYFFNDVDATKVSRRSESDKDEAHPRKRTLRKGGGSVSAKRYPVEQVRIDVADLCSEGRQTNVESEVEGNFDRLEPCLGTGEAGANLRRDPTEKQSTVENELEGSSDCVEKMSTTTEFDKVTRMHSSERSRIRKSRQKGIIRSNEQSNVIDDDEGLFKSLRKRCKSKIEERKGTSVMISKQPCVIDDDEVLLTALRRCSKAKTRKHNKVIVSKLNVVGNAEPYLGQSVPTVLPDWSENNFRSNLREHDKFVFAGVGGTADDRIGDCSGAHDTSVSLNDEKFENLESRPQDKFLQGGGNDYSELVDNHHPRLGLDESLPNGLKGIYEAVDEFSLVSFFQGIDPLHPDCAPLESCKPFDDAQLD